MPKTKRATIKLPVDTLEAIEKTAQQHGVTRHFLLRMAVFAAVEDGTLSEFIPQKVKAPA